MDALNIFKFVLEELRVSKIPDSFPSRAIFLVSRMDTRKDRWNLVVSISSMISAIESLLSSRAIFSRGAPDENLSTSVFPLSELLCKCSLTKRERGVHPRINHHDYSRRLKDSVHIRMMYHVALRLRVVYVYRMSIRSKP